MVSHLTTLTHEDRERLKAFAEDERDGASQRLDRACVVAERLAETPALRAQLAILSGFDEKDVLRAAEAYVDHLRDEFRFYSRLVNRQAEALQADSPATGDYFIPGVGRVTRHGAGQ